MSRKVHMRLESGTCNVCSAPCSSCMHFNRTFMGSKVDESPDEGCRGDAASQNSINEGDGSPPLKSRARESTATSSHDSFSENVENKANLRSSHIEDAFKGVGMCFNLRSLDASDQRAVLDKSEDTKRVEGHDDNIFCDIGANDENIVVSNDSRSVDRKNSALVSNLGAVGRGNEIQCQAGLGNFDLSFDGEGSDISLRRQSRYIDGSKQKVPHIDLLTAVKKYDLSDVPVSNGKDSVPRSPQLYSPSSHSGSRKSSTCNVDVKDLEKDISSRSQGKLPDCSLELLESSLTKETTSNTLPGQKYECLDICQNLRGSLIGGSVDVAVKNNLKSEAESRRDCDDPSDQDLKCLGQSAQSEKLDDQVELPHLPDSPLQSSSEDESDESDIVEHDVKVCDICGDAGREDLLAVCSRCSDGAEHTYCMRERLDKVPEGEWLCEECKLTEETEKEKQDKIEIVDEKEKNHLSGHASTIRTDLFVSVETKDTDVEGNRTNKVSPVIQVSRKRHPDIIDIASSAKRQALETSKDSPKVCSPSKPIGLSRDTSFKNLDKGKVKLAHQMSFGTSATDPRLQTARGALLKSNSFSTLNSKAKVKLADDEIPHKQKGARETGSSDSKEGPVKMLSKSMSFRPANSGRSNAAESKVKMLSSNFPHFQDIKGLRKAKPRDTFERKSFPKSDRSAVSSATSSSTVSVLKADQKLTSRGESIALTSANNTRESKPVPFDGKLSMSSKTLGSLARRGLELPGEGKKQTFSTSGIVASADQKPNQVTPKEEHTTSSSRITERPFNISNGVLQDGLPLSGESASLAEKIGENTTRSRQGVTSGERGVPCQKCNETSHATHSCSVASPRVFSVDASSARSLVDQPNKGSKLKAAIHAAMLKKPGIYKKNKAPDQSDELSLSSTGLNCEVALQEPSSVSGHLKNTVSSEKKHEVQAILRSSASDSFKQTNISNGKLLSVQPTESMPSFKTWEPDSIVPFDGKPNMRELSSHASSSVFLQISAFPEHEYTWQGDFEVHRRGKVPESCGGIQAHLSTCASPKVLDVVNKFPSKLPLSEVPRLSTWPSHFQDNGATEDHIALYFFAKDIESYEKNYKNLLESMMKNDLTLKGNFDGVELLIFPSNQLPDKSQRWNMLFFLWGVFRVRRVNCSDHMPSDSKKLDIPSLDVVTCNKDIPSAVMSFSESLCSPRRIEESYACGRSSNAVESSTPVSTKLSSPSSAETINGDDNSKLSSLDQMVSGSQANLGQQDGNLSRIPASITERYPESGCMRAPLEAWRGDPDCKLDVKLQPPVQATQTASSFSKGEKIARHPGIPNNRQETSYPFGILSVGPDEVVSTGTLSEEKILNRVNSSTDQAQIEKNVKEEEGSDMEVCLDGDTLMEDISMKEPNSWKLNHRKRPRLDIPETASEASSSGTNESMPRDDGENTSKKLKTVYNGVDRYYRSSSQNALSVSIKSEVHDLDRSTLDKESVERTCDEMNISPDPGSAERYLFPVVSCPVKDFPLGETSVPWKLVPPKDEIWVRHGDSNRLDDDVPNLELALGAEMKSPKQGVLPQPEQGMLPFLVGRVEKKSNQVWHPDLVTTKEEEDDVSASLSLSLSFPFPDKEATVKPGQKKEPILPDRRRVNTPFLLFGGLSDK